MFLSCSLLDKWNVVRNTAALACPSGWVLSSGSEWSLEMEHADVLAEEGRNVSLEGKSS